MPGFVATCGLCPLWSRPVSGNDEFSGMSGSVSCSKCHSGKKLSKGHDTKITQILRAGVLPRDGDGIYFSNVNLEPSRWKYPLLRSQSTARGALFKGTKRARLRRILTIARRNWKTYVRARAMNRRQRNNDISPYKGHQVGAPS